MKTNLELLANAIVENGYGTAEQVANTIAKGKRLPFMTYQEWANSGYQVQKGEKAAFKVNLWVKSDRKDADGNLVNNGFIYKRCSIFTAKQVKKMGEDSEVVAEPKTEKTEVAPKEVKKTTRKAKSTKKTRKAEVVKTEKKSAPKTEVSELPTRNKDMIGKRYEINGKTLVFVEDKSAPKTESKVKTRKTTNKKVVKKSAVKAAPKKTPATKELVKSNEMKRSEFIENGIKFVKYEREDGKLGFTMPLADYENMKNKKKFDKMFGIA